METLILIIGFIFVYTVTGIVISFASDITLDRQPPKLANLFIVITWPIILITILCAFIAAFGVLTLIIANAIIPVSMNRRRTRRLLDYMKNINLKEL